MKALLPVLLLCAAGALPASDEGVTPAPRPRLTEELRREAIQRSPATHKRNATPQSREDTPPISQYRVLESDHGLASRVDAPPPDTRPFTLKDGGTYWVREGEVVTTEMRLQYDASPKGWDLFKISW